MGREHAHPHTLCTLCAFCTLWPIPHTHDGPVAAPGDAAAPAQVPRAIVDPAAIGHLNVSGGPVDIPRAALVQRPSAVLAGLANDANNPPSRADGSMFVARDGPTV